MCLYACFSYETAESIYIKLRYTLKQIGQIYFGD